MEQPRHRIEMRRYAIVNALMAAVAALVLLLHDDPAAPAQPIATPRAAAARTDAPPLRRYIRFMSKHWSTS